MDSPCVLIRRPVAATINAEPIVGYKGGVFHDDEYSQESNHIVSIVGWVMDEESGKQAWLIRNSWGQVRYFEIVPPPIEY